VIGLAFRLPPNASSTTPWDVLLASTGGGRLTRLAVRPVVQWSGQSLCSVMPLRYQGTNWMLRGQIRSDIEGAGVSLDSIRNGLSKSPLTVDIEQAQGFGPFRPVARLTIKDVVPQGDSDDIGFDPVLHVPADIQLMPQWLAKVRVQAYRRSRMGRGGTVWMH
jgi:hypothetical protein